MRLKILYVCNEDRATTKQRLLALKQLGVQFQVIYTSRLNAKIPFLTRIYRAAIFRLGFFPERNNENKQIISALKKDRYDVLFVEKGLSVTSATLRNARYLYPGMKIISYSLDDMMNPGNLSRQYRNAIGLYDIHFTNKRYNVAELTALGARKVVYFRNAYSKDVHHPVVVPPHEKEIYQAEVSFIGTYAKDRVYILRYLADNGITIKIWGWGRSAENSGMIHPNLIMTNKYVYDEEYPKVVCSSKINLCFLRKENRDTETTRSIEIPACGGFMMAERTDAHKELFEEDVEAVYFDNKEELLDKIRYYLQRENERSAIASNALQRCLTEDYSYHHQLTRILNQALEYEAIGYHHNSSDTVQRSVV